jgi:hypothetical protein
MSMMNFPAIRCHINDDDYNNVIPSRSDVDDEIIGGSEVSTSAARLLNVWPFAFG